MARPPGDRLHPPLTSCAGIVLISAGQPLGTSGAEAMGLDAAPAGEAAPGDAPGRNAQHGYLSNLSGRGRLPSRWSPGPGRCRPPLRLRDRTTAAASGRRTRGIDQGRGGPATEPPGGPSPAQPRRAASPSDQQVGIRCPQIGGGNTFRCSPGHTTEGILRTRSGVPMHTRATPRSAQPRFTVVRRFVKSASSPPVRPTETRHTARSVPNVTRVTPSARGDGMGAFTCRRAAAVVLLAVITVAGCTDARPNAGPPASSEAPTSTTPSSSAPDLRASATANVLAAYGGFTDAASRAERHPKRAPSELQEYATDKALANVLATIALYRQQGISVQGQAKHDPEVVALTLNGDPATATIRDCIDLTDVTAIYRETGKSALAPNQSQRHVATAEAVMVNDRWMVRDVAADRTRPC